MTSPIGGPSGTPAGGGGQRVTGAAATEAPVVRPVNPAEVQRTHMGADQYKGTGQKPASSMALGGEKPVQATNQLGTPATRPAHSPPGEGPPKKPTAPVQKPTRPRPANRPANRPSAMDKFRVARSNLTDKLARRSRMLVESGKKLLKAAGRPLIKGGAAVLCVGAAKVLMSKSLGLASDFVFPEPAGAGSDFTPAQRHQQELDNRKHLESVRQKQLRDASAEVEQKRIQRLWADYDAKHAAWVASGRKGPAPLPPIG